MVCARSSPAVKNLLAEKTRRSICRNREARMYVVLGVTGNTGSVVADTLLRQGKPVRVVVRDAAKAAPWKQRGAEVAVAQVQDSRALAQALRGAQGAYLLLPPDYRSQTQLAD